MAFDELAQRLFGARRAESDAILTDATTGTIHGVALTDSEGGAVTVEITADVTAPEPLEVGGETYFADAGVGVEIPTSESVRAGDEVLVSTYGAGTMRSPVVTAAVGSGDRMAQAVTEAHDLAASVEGIAQEAAAEVEQVRQDVADFRDDAATTYATKVERQDGDDAVKTWVTTNYTNSNDLATTYATKTLVSQTKDAIELAASQTYETQSDAAATYATKSALTVGLDGIRSEVAEDYQPKGDYATTASMNSAIQQSATSIESSVAATYETKSDAATTYATKTEVQQTASGLDTRITTAQSTADGAYLERSGSGTTIDTTGAATIRSLVVEGQSVQDGTPTPSAPVPIVNVESRNLLPGYSATTVNGITFTVDGSGAVTANGTASATVNHYVLFTVPETGAYAMSGCPAGGSASTYQLWTYDTTTPRDQQLIDTGSGATGTLHKGHIISVRIRIQSGYTATNLTFRPMLERGSTAHPYQPYGCVTLVAGSTRTDIDLQGHALRSLPDGTHDEMAVDSLGRVTMTQRVGVTTTATTDGITATVGVDAMSTTGDLSDGATVIYPLATPQTIDLGTIDLPAPADTLWLDAALVPTIEATWWTVDGIAGQQALDAEVTERQTLIRQFSGGVLAGYVGNAIAALVNAAGSFDVVRTAWANGVPSILGTLATFGANLIRIGGTFASSGRSTAKVQFFEDDSALTDLTAEHYISTTTEPQVSHDLALSSTVTDDELPNGTSRTVTGNVEVWEQIYNDGSTYSDEVTASLNGATTNRQYNASVGVSVIEASGGQVERTAFAVADNLRLTHGIGQQASTTDVPMEQAIAALTTPLYSDQSSVTINRANADISGPSVTVPAGAYIIVVAYSFPAASGSGTRVTTVGYKPSTGSAQYNTFVQGSRAAVRLSMFNIVHVTAQTSFTAYVRSDQTSGSSSLYIGMTRIS